MSMRFDRERKRIICRWEEPTKVVMNKKEGFIHRSRMITVKVNDSGRLNSKDIRRHEKHPLFPHINRFNKLLNKVDCLPGRCEGHRCAVCDTMAKVNPYFDVKRQSLIWLCPDHVADSPRVDA